MIRFFFSFILIFLLINTCNCKIREKERLKLKESIKEMFFHAYNGYMTHAFPQDELDPISCKGKIFDSSKVSMVTLIDTLSTLAVMDEKEEFTKAIRIISETMTFDKDVNVNVFETTIRIVGGLLSAHVLVTDEKLQLWTHPIPYGGELLTLATDLGERLLPAFDTPTGIPYGTINLIYGVPVGETTEACTAGAGSLTLEMGLLSKLTDDLRFYEAARIAVVSLHSFKTENNLVGKHLDITSGVWSEKTSGIGSNSDSYYEYLIKAYIAFGDPKFWYLFKDLYEGILLHSKVGPFYYDISLVNLKEVKFGIDNLSAFWPSIQIMAGDVPLACDTLNAYYDIIRDIGFLPEEFDTVSWDSSVMDIKGGYLLRPEVIESTFHMYAATKDDTWLLAGKEMLKSLKKLKTKCGYASLKKINNLSSLHNDMPSFFLSETLKYLYLLFDKDNFIYKGNYILTTEAHIFPVFDPFFLKNSVYPPLINNIIDTCPSFNNHKYVYNYAESMCSYNGAVSGEYREDKCLLTSEIKSYLLNNNDLIAKNEKGDKKIASGDKDNAVEYKIDGGILGTFSIITSTTFPGFQIKRDASGDVIGVSGIDFRIGMIYEFQNEIKPTEEIIGYTSLIPSRGPLSKCIIKIDKVDLPCKAGSFGLTTTSENIKMTNLLVPSMTEEGCERYSDIYSKVVVDKFVMIRRGNCTFETKVSFAFNAGAHGVIIIDNADSSLPFMVTGDTGNLYKKIPVVLVSHKSGDVLFKIVRESLIEMTAAPSITLILKNLKVKDSPMQMFGSLQNASDLGFLSLLTSVSSTNGVRILNRGFGWGLHLNLVENVYQISIINHEDTMKSWE